MGKFIEGIKELHSVVTAVGGLCVMSIVAYNVFTSEKPVDTVKAMVTTNVSGVMGSSTNENKVAVPDKTNNNDKNATPNKNTIVPPKKSEETTSTNTNNTEIPKPLKSITMTDIKEVFASSFAQDEYGSYSPKNLIDGRMDTCWAEGVGGLGVGENVIITFKEKCKLEGIHIWAGYQKNQDTFDKNSRPATVKLVDENGYNETFDIPNRIGMQTLKLKKTMNTKSVKLVIDRVQPGNKYTDTCISEIDLF